MLRHIAGTVRSTAFRDEALREPTGLLIACRSETARQPCATLSGTRSTTVRYPSLDASLSVDVDLSSSM